MKGGRKTMSDAASRTERKKGLSLSRREFVGLIAGSAASLALTRHVRGQGRGMGRARPNVVLIITDDQGYGDLGCHGNDRIRTPNLDRLARESVEFTQFHVCPVCSPTRASLMTGRYNYRTGVVDTYLGRSMMYPDEVTIAELFGAAGYHTGIFGKWHLGDNYPLRSIDQGFEESLVHKGGGIGQPSDPPGNAYFDPVLQHNGRTEKYRGYCTDIFTIAAIEFIQSSRSRPFFVYLSTNAPHTPLQIDEAYVAPYRAMRLDESTARVYGMVANIDENVGRLLEKLSELHLEEETIIIFLTDNGPQQDRYNCGMRGRKGSVYEGGIRVPFFMRWPGTLKGGKRADQIAAHIDVLPTLLDACGIPMPGELSVDGISLLPLLRGDGVKWPDRTLYFQWHRGDEPELYRACAARSEAYKLVNGKELYDMLDDPAEKSDIAAQHPDVVERMRRGYEEWFRDVSATRGYDPPRIYLGTRFENPVILTPQDWRGPRAGWGSNSLGYWEVKVARSGAYDIRLQFGPAEGSSEAHFKLAGAGLKQPLENGATSCTFQGVHLDAGDGRLEAWIASGDQAVGVSYVEVERPS
jgi:arylsulfatase A-like enzyme